MSKTNYNLKYIYSRTPSIHDCQAMADVKHFSIKHNKSILSSTSLGGNLVLPLGIFTWNLLIPLLMLINVDLCTQNANFYTFDSLFQSWSKATPFLETFGHYQMFYHLQIISSPWLTEGANSFSYFSTLTSLNCLRF